MDGALSCELLVRLSATAPSLPSSIDADRLLAATNTAQGSRGIDSLVDTSGEGDDTEPR
jgi:hypothetical protein